MKVCIAGEGAQGKTHMEALVKKKDVEVVTVAGGIEADTVEFAREWGIPHYSMNLEECIEQPGVEAVVLTTPNHLHAAQTELALQMGKHVLLELPMGLTLAESQRVAEREEEIDGEIFDLLASLGDFLVFKQRMLDCKAVR